MPVSSDQPAMTSSCLPEVFVVGAAKAGTTAIYEYFKAHPQIYVPASVKETNYMAFFNGTPEFIGPGDQSYLSKSITSLEKYVEIYRLREGKPFAADVSPFYLYCPQTPAKISELCPQAKIALVLRNPAECAFSMFSMYNRQGLETTRSFEKAFSLSEQRLANGWSWSWDYKEFFKFAKQVERYLTLFPAPQLFIRRYEELKNNPAAFYRDLTQFIGVSEIDRSRFNRQVNEGARQIDLMLNTRVGRLFWQTARMIGKAAPKSFKANLLNKLLYQPVFFKKSFPYQRGLSLSPAERRMLVEHYRDDIGELAKLLNWNLDDWLVR